MLSGSFITTAPSEAKLCHFSNDDPKKVCGQNENCHTEDFPRISPLESVENPLIKASRCQVFFIMLNVSSTIALFSYNLLINFLMSLKDILGIWLQFLQHECLSVRHSTSHLTLAELYAYVSCFEHFQSHFYYNLFRGYCYIHE
jgi:hypothetical protein